MQSTGQCLLVHACMLKVKGIQTRSPKTNMKPNLSAIISHLLKVAGKQTSVMLIDTMVEYNKLMVDLRGSHVLFVNEEIQYVPLKFSLKKKLKQDISCWLKKFCVHKDHTYPTE